MFSLLVEDAKNCINPFPMKVYSSPLQHTIQKNCYLHMLQVTYFKNILPSSQVSEDVCITWNRLARQLQSVPVKNDNCVLTPPSPPPLFKKK